MKNIKFWWLILAAMVVCGNASAAAAIAEVPGDSAHNGIAYGYSDIRTAKSEALKQCEEMAHKNGVKGRCRVVLSDAGPGYIAIAGGDDGTGYGYGASAQNAIDAAAGACTKSYKNCKTNSVEYWEDFVGQKANASSCVPNTGLRQCRSECDNGSCILTYKNGCKVQLQMQPRFNPITTAWEYPPPQC